MHLRRIISGGQTGADQGALEAAKELGIQTGGWAPKGYLTEYGSDPSLQNFGLLEHISQRYSDRTEMNVHVADVTVWFGNTNSSGYYCTYKAAVKYKKPFLENPDAADFIIFLEKNDVNILNIAGNRESSNPGIHNYVKDFLLNCLGVFYGTTAGE